MILKVKLTIVEAGTYQLHHWLFLITLEAGLGDLPFVATQILTLQFDLNILNIVFVITEHPIVIHIFNSLENRLLTLIANFAFDALN